MSAIVFGSLCIKLFNKLLILWPWKWCTTLNTRRVFKITNIWKSCSWLCHCLVVLCTWSSTLAVLLHQNFLDGYWKVNLIYKCLTNKVWFMCKHNLNGYNKVEILWIYDNCFWEWGGRYLETVVHVLVLSAWHWLLHDVVWNVLYTSVFKMTFLQSITESDKIH